MEIFGMMSYLVVDVCQWMVGFTAWLTGLKLVFTHFVRDGKHALWYMHVFIYINLSEDWFAHVKCIFDSINSKNNASFSKVGKPMWVMFSCFFPFLPLILVSIQPQCFPFRKTCCFPVMKLNLRRYLSLNIDHLDLSGFSSVISHYAVFFLHLLKPANKWWLYKLHCHIISEDC